ncbi:FHA domain-containing protein [Ruegeria sp. HKCCD7559]|uniref:FHA domain-containing protein n=1 Tax=Ruegeria sp. HKCCD7559 TaxID=2683005 RepID=UPI001490DC81|nr:FHA domain-containing protein [Ruegeria sp. HKCCD7559]NOC45431.1 FHA domain-containing protein [Ruegeria sp. HKCCD7559]
MFKYKSPLSRLLEGAGKSKEEDVAEKPATVDGAVSEEEKQEPIADFNALRAALAGGNMTSESYEETDELIPEEKMPEFDEAEPEALAEPEESIFAEDSSEEDNLEEGDALKNVLVEENVEELVEVEQVVTLHVTETPAETSPEEATAEVVSEPTEPEVGEVEVAEAPAPEEKQVEDTVEPVIEQVETAPAPVEDRRSRVKTTFLGFERADTHVQDLIESSEPVAKAEAAQETFPVGWLVVTAGPGRGSSITLTEGLMQIGRNDDQAIQLDFGDTGISRSNHAVIAYDPEDRKCYLGHGGKANLVRLNGKPVLSTVALSNGDLIRISETSIRFMAFCDDGFDWRDS